jgi:hypothetical protein
VDDLIYLLAIGRLDLGGKCRIRLMAFQNIQYEGFRTLELLPMNDTSARDFILPATLDKQYNAQLRFSSFLSPKSC